MTTNGTHKNNRTGRPAASRPARTAGSLHANLIADHLDDIEQAARLHVALTGARALCGVCREVFEDGQPGVDWDRARRMQRDTGLLLSVIETAIAEPREAVFAPLALDFAHDPQKAVLAMRRAMAVYEQMLTGRLTAGVRGGRLSTMTLYEAEAVAGIVNEDGEYAAGWA